MSHLTTKLASILLYSLAILLPFGCGCPHRYTPSSNPEPPLAFYIPEKIHIALVLGSGGVRGIAHVGVLEELEAAGIEVDLIVGCSAGSIVGALYADNPHVEAIKCAIWQMRASSLLDFDLWNCRYGLSQDYALRRVLHEHLSATTFEELQIPLVIVATDLNSGELVPLGSGDLVKAVQASCSIPFIFVPCQHRGRVLVDGGVINPVPVKVAHDLGAEFIIAVDLSELLAKTFPTNLFEVAARSAEIALMWQNEVCTHHADVVIRPKTCDVGTFNDNMKWQIYEAGKQAAREQLPLIQEKLAALRKNPCEPFAWRLVQPSCYVPQICQKQDESEPRNINEP